MTHLVEFPLHDGGAIQVEIAAPEDRADAPSEGQGLVPAARGEAVAKKAHQTFEAALDKIQPAAEVIIQKLRYLSDAPDTIQVEFGVKMNAEVGAVVASASAEAHYKINLTWQREKSGGSHAR
jgi:hypothetical protein